MNKEKYMEIVAKKMAKQRFKFYTILFLSFIGIVTLLVFIVFVVQDSNYESELILSRYNKVGTSSVDGTGVGDKKLNFLVSYESETTDYELRFALGKKDTNMSAGVGGSSDPGSNAGNDSGSGGTGDIGSYEDIDVLAECLKNAGMKSEKCKYMAYAYFYFKETNSAEYTDEVCSAIIGNINLEGTPGIIENLKYTKNPPKGINLMHTCAVDGSKFYTCQKHLNAGYCKSSGICVHSIDGTLLDSKDKLDYLKSIGNDPNQPGIGMIQASGNRRLNLLNEYENSGLDYTVKYNQAYIEVRFINTEAHGSESSAFNRIKGTEGGESSARNLGFIWRKYYERPGSDTNAHMAEAEASKAYTAITTYQNNRK